MALTPRLVISTGFVLSSGVLNISWTDVQLILVDYSQQLGSRLGPRGMMDSLKEGYLVSHSCVHAGVGDRFAVVPLQCAWMWTAVLVFNASLITSHSSFILTSKPTVFQVLPACPWVECMRR